MNKIKKYINKSWILSPIITCIMMLAIYMVKGIYPFGNVDISYYDMSQNYVPAYTHAYDFYHGNQGLFWEWYNCGGVTIVDSFCNFILNPFNLFFLFVKRNKILQSLSLFLLLKISFSAFAMSYFVDKKYQKLSCDWKVVLGILYASSGYIIQYYTNIQFLDTVAIFPLLMYSVDLLIEYGRRKWLVVFMILGMLSNIQIMVMVCIYVVIYSFVFSYNHDHRKKVIVDLGLSVAISTCISAIALLPTILANVGTTRLGVSNNIYSTNIYNMLKNTYFDQKLFMCYGIEIVIAVFIICLFDRKKYIPKMTKELLLGSLLLIPVFIDCINIVWHIVGYMAFPMRFGFILTFTAILILAKYLLLKGEIETDIKNLQLKNLISFVLGGVGLFIMYYCIIPLREYGAVDPDFYASYGIGLIVLIVVYVSIFLLKTNRRVIVLIIMCQCVLGWYVLLAPQNDAYQPEMASEYIINSYELSDSVDHMLDEDSRIARLRDDSNSLNVNYPVLLTNTAMSGWYNGCNSNLRYFAQKMGYGAHFTRLLNTGGTVFSDAVYHTRKIVSYNDQEIACHVIDKYNDYYLKETDVYYPYGILVDENIVGWNDDEKNVFQYQNSLISVLHNENIELFSSFSTEDICDIDNLLLEDGRYYTSYELGIYGQKILYIKGRKTGTNALQIVINGEVVNINDLTIPDNTVYPGYFNNGVITLGEFENEMVYCEIVSSEPIAEGEISIAAMDINLLKEKTEEQHKYEREITPTNNGLKYKVNNTDGYPYLLLPIGFQDKFWCKVNGKFVECEPCVEDALTLIPIEEGMNEISLVYIPRGLITGAIISVIGLIALIIMWKRWDAILEIKWLQNVANVCFTLLFWAIIVCIYIIPTIAEVVLRFIWNPFGI